MLRMPGRFWGDGPGDFLRHNDRLKTKGLVRLRIQHHECYISSHIHIGFAKMQSWKVKDRLFWNIKMKIITLQRLERTLQTGCQKGGQK